MPDVDWLVVTASNRAQARAYRAQIQARRGRHPFPVPARVLVIPDPRGRRAGSGGSTLWVLLCLARNLLRRRPDAPSIRSLFEKQRILIIHSGGDSRRLCSYAAQGKVFLPLPCTTADGAPAALFDLIVSGLASLSAPAQGQVLIAAGDVLLTFAPEAVRFDRPGVTGVAYPGTIERGSRHGVYVADRGGRVLDFLQKPDEATALARGAVDEAGRVLVDTGLLSLDPESVALWLKAAGARLAGGRLSIARGLLDDLLRGVGPPLDLYEQWLMAFVPALDEEAYVRAALARTRSGARWNRTRLVALHRSLHRQPFQVNILPFCDFFHVGTTRELLSNVGTLNRTARAHGFANFDQSYVAARASVEGAFVYNSVLESAQINAGPGVLLESVRTEQAVDLPRSNVVVGWPHEASTALRLPEGWGAVCLPVRAATARRTRAGRKRPAPQDSWAVVLFGIADDFKTPAGEGGTFGNRPLLEFLGSTGLSESSLWPGIDPARRTLWNARLWSVGEIDGVLEATLWMCGPPRKDRVARWAKRPRLCMDEVLGRVDHDRMRNQREENRRVAELFTLERRFEGGPRFPASRLLGMIKDGREAGLVQAQIARLLDRSEDSLLRAHLYEFAHLVARRHRRGLPSQHGMRRGSMEKNAFALVAQAVSRNVQIPDEPRPAKVLPDQVVWVTCPVRTDFSGGWSDTPPICTEMGGTVLNAAVTLNGQYPVQVIAKLQEKPRITLTSLDLAERVDILTTPSPEECVDPRHWAALPKAALILAGICPRDPRVPLRRWLHRLGGGLDITLFSALPKGSGLGTSSILGAAVLACMARVLGESLPRETLIARTSILEQMMTTGGGWQDQIGGIEPGVKLIRTRAAVDQTPSIHRIAFDFSPGGSFRSRMLLYYTGYTRMARNILQNVVARYLARDAETIQIIHQLKGAAERMESELGSGDADGFGRGIDRYWELKKQIDPGSTNARIEALIRPLNRYLTGRLLPGAGGGGFLLMVARDEEAAGRVRRHLAVHPPNALARFFDLDIDNRGLSVTVL